MEAYRAEHHPDAVSRLRGFFAFDDAASAQAAAKEWPAIYPNSLAEVGILPGSRISRHDADWITHHLGRGGTDWMDPYLRGEPWGANPIWELVVDGRAQVYGTSLREEAYDVVRSRWPRSMALLELSRVAVELGSDLGLIAPMLLGAPNDLRIDYVMSFADATNPDFLERLSAYDGPKNYRDVPHDFELVVPDLRQQSFKLS